MSDTATTTTTTVHTLYRPGDKVRFRYGSPAYLADPTPYAGSLHGTYEGVLSADPWDPTASLRMMAGDQTMRPEGVTETTAPTLTVISLDGTTPGNGIYDITLIERFGLPVWLLDKSREDHAPLFTGRFRDEVTHALVFTSTSTGGDEALTVPYAPSARAGWQIRSGDLTLCGLPADHALHGEEGWWVPKAALRKVGVMFPEEVDLDVAAVVADLDETPEEPKSEADLELERLRAEVEHLMDVNRRLAQADQDLRREVGTVAMWYAREHGWCGVVRDALSDIGIDPVEQKQEVWLTVRVKATGISSTSDPSRDWTRSSISVDEYNIEQSITFDGDWEDVEVDFMEIEVDSVEPLEE